jgi:hypothetical protein
VKLLRLRRPKTTYTDYRPKPNAAILLETGHTLRGKHAWEEKGKGRKPKT